MTQTRKTSLLTYGIVILFLWIALLGICYFTGILPSFPQYNAQITQFSVCTEKSITSTTTLIPGNNNQFYFCGHVEGTSNQPGTLYIFQGDTVIFQTSVDLKPGDFYIPIPVKELDSFALGSYHAEIRYEKQIRAKANFEVVKAASP